MLGLASDLDLLDAEQGHRVFAPQNAVGEMGALDVPAEVELALVGRPGAPDEVVAHVPRGRGEGFQRKEAGEPEVQISRQKVDRTSVDLQSPHSVRTEEAGEPSERL